jgi:hypothetical protein
MLTATVAAGAAFVKVRLGSNAGGRNVGTYGSLKIISFLMLLVMEVNLQQQRLFQHHLQRRVQPKTGLDPVFICLLISTLTAAFAPPAAGAYSTMSMLLPCRGCSLLTAPPAPAAFSPPGAPCRTVRSFHQHLNVKLENVQHLLPHQLQLLLLQRQPTLNQSLNTSL